MHGKLFQLSLDQWLEHLLSILDLLVQISLIFRHLSFMNLFKFLVQRLAFYHVLLVLLQLLPLILLDLPILVHLLYPLGCLLLSYLFLRLYRVK